MKKIILALTVLFVLGSTVQGQQQRVNTGIMMNLT